jgi:hypothetical protein
MAHQVDRIPMNGCSVVADSDTRLRTHGVSFRLHTRPHPPPRTAPPEACGTANRWSGVVRGTKVVVLPRVAPLRFERARGAKLREGGIAAFSTLIRFQGFLRGGSENLSEPSWPKKN